MFQTKIHYVKGTNNVADCLSRDLTPAGNSLLPEKGVNDFLNNKLGCSQATGALEILQRLQAQGYDCKNHMTPEQVLDILDNPGEHDIEIIYETRSSNPTIDDEVLTPSSQPPTGCRQ